MTKIKKGDFIELDYTGKSKEEGIIFDTTIESVAKENGLYSGKAEYAPVIVCVGQKHLLPGLDGHLEGTEAGKGYTFDIPPEGAFGKKDAKLLQLVPTARFKKENIQPMPGMQVDIDNHMGVIKTVSGGRTLVDFNHPLSGKEVVYSIDIKRIVEDSLEKVRSLLRMQLGLKGPEISMKDGTVEVDFPQEMPKEIVEMIEKQLAELVPDVKKLVFVAKPKADDKEGKAHQDENRAKEHAGHAHNEHEGHSHAGHDHSGHKH
ncbi:MAG: FKBP-type peptidyl-prolyl cis-trans isomerase SlyD [archaeon GW2011_AR3]|nr:MAG: FKBP-type peptidyl-prolyl cis-trans isomerase SlyD [archaeon GW2011_AR3]MBS3109921.1 FKBP-type peptidyl-prolyl cis-trans isomerase [Candidatus Woesearchaeota archaeon]